MLTINNEAYWQLWQDHFRVTHAKWVKAYGVDGANTRLALTHTRISMGTVRQGEELVAAMRATFGLFGAAKAAFSTGRYVGLALQHGLEFEAIGLLEQLMEEG